MGKKMIAEALGTAILVLFGCGTAVIAGASIGFVYDEVGHRLGLIDIRDTHFVESFNAFVGHFIFLLSVCCPYTPAAKPITRAERERTWNDLAPSHAKSCRTRSALWRRGETARSAVKAPKN